MIEKLIKLMKTFVQPININSKLYSKVYIFENSVCFVRNSNVQNLIYKNVTSFYLNISY